MNIKDILMTVSRYDELTDEREFLEVVEYDKLRESGEFSPNQLTEFKTKAIEVSLVRSKGETSNMLIVPYSAVLAVTE